MKTCKIYQLVDSDNAPRAQELWLKDKALYYRFIATVVITNMLNSLSQAYQATQDKSWINNPKVKWSQNVPLRSTTIGDVIVDEYDEEWIVSDKSFELIEDPYRQWLIDAIKEAINKRAGTASHIIQCHDEACQDEIDDSNITIERLEQLAWD